MGDDFVSLCRLLYLSRRMSTITTFTTKLVPNRTRRPSGSRTTPTQRSWMAWRIGSTKKRFLMVRRLCGGRKTARCWRFWPWTIEKSRMPSSQFIAEDSIPACSAYITQKRGRPNCQLHHWRSGISWAIRRKNWLLMLMIEGKRKFGIWSLLSQIVYLFSASWLELFETNVLIAVWANRYQNVTTITLCTFASGKCVKVGL